MIENADFLTTFSANRLRGDAPPPDLALLLAHREALALQTGFAFDSSSSWTPWLDTSYLRESEWANPDIRANVKAIAEVCASIDFVTADEDQNYFGYWRGQAHVAISQAPIVRLDNEGQFEFCGTANMAGAILTASGGALFEEVRSWMQGIGIGSLPRGPYDLFDVDTHPSPRELHKTLYEKLLMEEQRA